jgi:hypothetical protein
MAQDPTSWELAAPFLASASVLLAGLAVGYIVERRAWSAREGTLGDLQSRLRDRFAEVAKALDGNSVSLFEGDPNVGPRQLRQSLAWGIDVASVLTATLGLIAADVFLIHDHPDDAGVVVVSAISCLVASVVAFGSVAFQGPSKRSPISWPQRVLLALNIVTAAVLLLQI